MRIVAALRPARPSPRRRPWAGRRSGPGSSRTPSAAAAVLDGLELECLSQHLEQRLIGRRLDLAGSPVELKADQFHRIPRSQLAELFMELLDPPQALLSALAERHGDLRAKVIDQAHRRDV